ncbi:MAG TPA: hypothetical protein VF254_03540, partial [Gammaproteobacteria bacterium]
LADEVNVDLAFMDVCVAGGIDERDTRIAQSAGHVRVDVVGHEERWLGERTQLLQQGAEVRVLRPLLYFGVQGNAAGLEAQQGVDLMPPNRNLDLQDAEIEPCFASSSLYRFLKQLGLGSGRKFSNH